MNARMQFVTMHLHFATNCYRLLSIAIENLDNHTNELPNATFGEILNATR